MNNRKRYSGKCPISKDELRIHCKALRPHHSFDDHLIKYKFMKNMECTNLFRGHLYLSILSKYSSNILPDDIKIKP